MQNNELLLLVSLAVLMLGIALLAHRRGAARRARRERARRDAMREDLGGDSYFLPPAPVEAAVELDDPVEIDSLLEGESQTVAAQARGLLERNTDTALTSGMRGLSFALGGPTPPPRPAPAPAIARATPATPAGRSPAAPEAADGAARVPVRDLVLAWYEARGYRAAALPAASRPLELLLNHRKTPARSYAFVATHELLGAQQATSLFALARAGGWPRLLIAAEGGAAAGLAKALQRQGIRVFDEAAINAELAKVDIRIAAKIIAVARGRAVTRRAADDVRAAAASRSALAAPRRPGRP